MNKIVGNTIATPMPIADWNQTDEKKADFIKNKPDIDGKINEVKNDITELQKSLNGKADGFTVENIQKEVENISEDVNKNKSNIDAMSNELSKTSSALPFKADKSSLEAVRDKAEGIEKDVSSLDNSLKTVSDALLSHDSNENIHVNSNDRANWNDKYTKEEADVKFALIENGVIEVEYSTNNASVLTGLSHNIIEYYDAKGNAVDLNDPQAHENLHTGIYKIKVKSIDEMIDYDDDLNEIGRTPSDSYSEDIVVQHVYRYNTKYDTIYASMLGAIVIRQYLLTGTYMDEVLFRQATIKLDGTVETDDYWINVLKNFEDCRYKLSNMNDPESEGYEEDYYPNVKAVKDYVDNYKGDENNSYKMIAEPIDNFERVDGEFFRAGTTSANSSWEWAKIPVNEGEEYIVTGTGNNYVHAINYCDAELNVISNTTESGTQSFIDEKITIPQGCYFVVLNRQRNNGTIQFNITKLVKTSFKPNKLKGKTIVNFGDSIFGMARPPYDVSTYLAELIEANVLNCGFGGCTMSSHNSEAYDPFAMYRIADAITSGDFTLQDNSLANNSSLPDYFDIRVQTLKSLDFNKVDIITIGYGINDYLKNKDVENDSNALDTNTYGGALRYSIEKILTTFPHIKIFVCSQTYMATLDGSYNYVTDSDTETNTIGKKLTDYVEKAKEISSSYHLKYIDNYYSLGINKFNRSVYFPKTDGVHHNRTGRNLIASHIAKHLF